MTSTSIWRQPKRLGALTVSGAMLLQAAAPVHAAVSQSPPTYVLQPDPNVMFTLDDSNSMVSDAIPDYISDRAGMLEDGNSSAVSGFGARFPNMWGNGSGYLAANYYNINNAIARYLRSSAGNPLYYDPAVTYKPWPLATNNNATHPNATPTAVNIHPTSPFNNARVIDITTQRGTGSNTYWPATHFIYRGATPMPLGLPNNALNVEGSFQKVEIRPGVSNYTKVSSRTDCTGAVGPNGCSYNEEIQNFANWLQYYRTRMLMTKGGIAAAFATQGTNLRVGFGSINIAGVVRPNQGVRQFANLSATDRRRESFFTDLYSAQNIGGTPLRRAMHDVGQYFSRTDVSNPYAFDPGRTQSPEYSCRRSFHIFSTDGFWNGDDATLPEPRDRDNFTGTVTPIPAGGTSGYTFTDNPPASADPLTSRFTINPFRDAQGSARAELSDVAAYYWLTDLRGGATNGLANNVPSSRRDPAFWQHLTTFTVGLGISGSGTVRRNSDGSTVVPASEPSNSPFYAHRGKTWLQDETMRDLVIAHKVALNWPAVAAESVTTGDDLIRAAMVGRGRYFSATNPTALANGIASALSEATDTPLSQSNLAVWSQELRADNRVYQATFSPASWYGRLYSYRQGLTGTVNPDPSTAVWEASNRMPAHGNRNIFTWNTDGVPGARLFTWANLNTAQRNALNGDENVLHYLRGDDSREIQNGGSFRDRTRYAPAGGGATPGVLGDIINSSPVKGMLFGASYQTLPAGTPGRDQYVTYRSASNPQLTNMINTIFVGANDGMLHAFDANTGTERFAFIPNSVYTVPRSISGGNENKLLMLSQPTYQHRYTVDGSPQLADVFIGPNAATEQWRTMLVSSTGAGARALFAMDVTNPAVDGSATSFGPSQVKWEFSEAHATHGNDMGYVMNYAHMARMANGKWAAIFGNGYDSATGRAALFIVDLWTGDVIRKIPVGPTPLASEGKNGLSQPNFIMRDRIVQYIYAGDLKGNLWKFDVTNPDPNAWAPSFGSAPNYEPLFSAGNDQPITVMPTIGLRHERGGAMLTFGTGELFDTTDTSTSTTDNVNLRRRQTIYGIWDKPSEISGFSGTTLLQEQSLDVAGGTSGRGLRLTTSTAVDYSIRRGWYMTLNTGGERVNVNPSLPNPNDPESPVFIVANTPAAAIPCTGGGSGRIFALNTYTGAAPSRPTFDADGSGEVNAADGRFNVVSNSRGILTQPVFQTGGGTTTTDPHPDPQSASVGNDGRSGANSGGRQDSDDRSAGTSGCGRPRQDNMCTGVSDTSIDCVGVQLARPASCSGRISWRQIQ
jgi:type IV pilus assembly protein PilY1